MKNSMKRFGAPVVLGLALACAALAFAGSAKHQAFVADCSGVAILLAPPSGTPASTFFEENDWTGSVSEPAALGTFTLTAIGTITVENPSQTIWNIHPDGVRFVMTFADGSTIQGTFKTHGTLDTAKGVVNTTGSYEFISGTGTFAHVKGAGTVGAQGTAADASCPFTGWIEY
jgi:hypothetical protein